MADDPPPDKRADSRRRLEQLHIIDLAKPPEPHEEVRLRHGDTYVSIWLPTDSLTLGDTLGALGRLGYEIIRNDALIDSPPDTCEHEYATGDPSCVKCGAHVEGLWPGRDEPEPPDPGRLITNRWSVRPARRLSPAERKLFGLDRDVPPDDSPPEDRGPSALRASVRGGLSLGEAAEWVSRHWPALEVTEEQERRLADWLCDEDSIKTVIAALENVGEQMVTRAADVMHVAYQPDESDDPAACWRDAMHAAFDAAGVWTLLSERDRLRVELDLLRDGVDR